MSRNLRNSQYITQVQKENTLVGLVPEDGALVMINNTIFYGDGEDWIEFSADNGVVKWVRYDDTEHSVGTPQTFTSFPFYLDNNAGDVFNPYALDLYDGATNTLTLTEGSSYILTVAFKAKISNANGYMEVYLECPTDPDYRQVADFIVFPKGNNVEHHYSKVMQFYANTNVAENGLKIVIDASHSGSVYECKYFIQKLN